mmetsp:Transcript_5556/g.17097  ORF Transcript_5556/g.17097 Transcript_5556/m.17097 type:complete len:238 (+) Transcript_5556:1206-1919(+)|eukprot:scaffold54313_cov34-Tisochrysis_lutea.AAC.3
MASQSPSVARMRKRSHACSCTTATCGSTSISGRVPASSFRAKLPKAREIASEGSEGADPCRLDDGRASHEACEHSPSDGWVGAKTRQTPRTFVTLPPHSLTRALSKGRFGLWSTEIRTASTSRGRFACLRETAPRDPSRGTGKRASTARVSPTFATYTRVPHMSVQSAVAPSLNPSARMELRNASSHAWKVSENTAPNFSRSPNCSDVENELVSSPGCEARYWCKCSASQSTQRDPP